ncbi:MAG: hypothetical protein AB4372_21095 [Xenococcus sp. (in: cyanobacteria)]
MVKKMNQKSSKYNSEQNQEKQLISLTQITLEQLEQVAGGDGPPILCPECLEPEPE